jgi:hypothetical protein
MMTLHDGGNTTHLIPGLMKHFSVGTPLVSWCLPRISWGRFWFALDHFPIISRDSLLALALALDPWLIGTTNLCSSNFLSQYAETPVAVLVNSRIINDFKVLSHRIFGAGRWPWRGRGKRVEFRRRRF